MSSLRTDGFAAMLSHIADLARKQATVADAARVACTLSGRISEPAGRGALRRPERAVLDFLERHDAVLEDSAIGWSLWLSDTGRLKIGPSVAGDGAPTDHLIGSARLPTSTPVTRRAAERLWQREEEAERAEFAQISAELAVEPRSAVQQRLDLICHAVVHMAPVRIYVGDRVYSNLGSGSNLPGKSLEPGAPSSVLTALEQLPVARWDVKDAVFVCCAAALIRSGSPVRLEEFNGYQLTPAALEEWLRERIRSYGAEPGVPTGGILARLDTLVGHCAARRSEAVKDGVQFYRRIQGVTLHKEERALVPPISPADIPARVAVFMRTEFGLRPCDGEAALREALGAMAPDLLRPAGCPRFGTRFEALLHALLEAIAEDTGSDVAMARGPRSLAGLDGSMPPERVLKLATNENYCCVVPSRAFRTRFAGDCESLVKALSAYSARMRYNTWHYLPDGLGLGGHRPGRDDWFFAPIAPDITTWSDQHHTGHVMFGVRYAIRVPIGVVFGGAYRPGLYDVRLMRAGEPPFTIEQLRAGIAVSRVLRAIHEVIALHPHRVDAFDNAWFRRVHG